MSEDSQLEQTADPIYSTDYGQLFCGKFQEAADSFLCQEFICFIPPDCLPQRNG